MFGVPKSPQELSVLLRKASYLIGGVRFSAAAMDQNVLAPPDTPAFGRVVVSGQQYCTVLYCEIWSLVLHCPCFLHCSITVLCAVRAACMTAGRTSPRWATWWRPHACQQYCGSSHRFLLFALSLLFGPFC